MKPWIRTFVLFLAGAATVIALAPDAEARRFGGGRSFGKSSGSLFKRAPAAKAAPRAGQAAGKTAANSRRGLMGPIAGLAAGLGLAALASYMGFGEELANFMMIALLIFGGLFIFRKLAARGAAASGGMRRSALQGAGPGGAATGPVSGLSAGGASAGQTAEQSSVPADFDESGFVRQAKVQFVRLQAVYDAADLNDLRDFTTPEVFAEIKLDIAERGETENKTDVVSLDGELLGVEEGMVESVAAVRFTGMIRENADEGAQAFDETWVLSKPSNGDGGWVVAGIQQNNGE